MFLFCLTGCKHKPASVLQNCLPKQAKNPFVSQLLKIIELRSIECNEPQLNIFKSLSRPHREITGLCLACITSYNATYAGRCSERPPITLRNHMIRGFESAALQNQCPTCKIFNKLHHTENVFQLKIILVILMRECLCNFERRLDVLDTVSKHQTSSKMVHLC